MTLISRRVSTARSQGARLSATWLALIAIAVPTLGTSTGSRDS